MRLIHAGVAQPAQAIVAHEQTSGKGQRGKSWQSTAGESLSFTLLLRPEPLQAIQAFQLLVAVALGAHTAVETMSGAAFTIKWPNDIFWGDRKAGGILIENVVHGSNWNWALVGVGINVNQQAFDPTLPHAVSLQQITGHGFDVRALALQLRSSILTEFDLLRVKGFTDRLDKYNQKLYGKGQIIRFRQQQRVFEAEVEGVAPNGYLLTRQGHQFRFGEVEWLL